MARPELVTHDAFYMKELNDMIDLKMDYDYWRTHQRLEVSRLIRSTMKNQSLSIRNERKFHSVIIHFSSI